MLDGPEVRHERTRTLNKLICELLRASMYIPPSKPPRFKIKPTPDRIVYPHSHSHSSFPNIHPPLAPHPTLSSLSHHTTPHPTNPTPSNSNPLLLRLPLQILIRPKRQRPTNQHNSIQPDARARAVRCRGRGGSLRVGFGLWVAFLRDLLASNDLNGGK